MCTHLGFTAKLREIKVGTHCFRRTLFYILNDGDDALQIYYANIIIIRVCLQQIYSDENLCTIRTLNNNKLQAKQKILKKHATDCIIYYERKYLTFKCIQGSTASKFYATSK